MTSAPPPPGVGSPNWWTEQRQRRWTTSQNARASEGWPGGRKELERNEVGAWGVPLNINCHVGKERILSAGKKKNECEMSGMGTGRRAEEANT